ncbi:hypothetical protein M0638_26520 [Roseomonas sp. NAR14]|uniref:Lipoprotein n=1 Tax=Roseomonas acroporae TaxID=2937791 RepID=A0A9X1YCI1_9PROT|nr:hypothetical protein [Roseomonas acroporae]MCK8787914.1 hypothetical protein [Roseomonas acroporae]
MSRASRPRLALLALGLPLGLSLGLAGCGKVGPVRAPGPPAEIVYPRSYPVYPPRHGQQPAAPPAPLTGAAPGSGGIGGGAAPGVVDPSQFQYH